MFDIANLDAQTRSESGMPMRIVHPRTLSPVLDANDVPVTITLLGRTSSAFRATQRRLRDARVDKASRGMKATQDDADRDELELLVAVTVGWTFDSMDGQPFPFSPDNARRLWGDPRYTWIREQAMAFVVQDGNFLAD